MKYTDMNSIFNTQLLMDKKYGTFLYLLTKSCIWLGFVSLLHSAVQNHSLGVIRLFSLRPRTFYDKLFICNNIFLKKMSYLYFVPHDFQHGIYSTRTLWKCFSFETDIH